MSQDELDLTNQPKQETLNKQKVIFGNLFFIPNKLQAIMDEDFAKYDLTAKQWFLMAVMDEFFQTPPTLTEVAERMGSTRQNVKQLALKLEEKGFLKIENDSDDRRALRLSLTEKCYKFWHNRENVDVNFLEELFKDFSPEEIDSMYKGIMKIASKVSKNRLP